MPVSPGLKADLPASGPSIRANRGQIRRLVENLVRNAREAVKEEAAGDDSGVVAVRLGTVAAADIPAGWCRPLDFRPEDSVYACLEVADSGYGIAAASLDKLFDPFYSTKFIGRGLGLSVVLGAVKAHGGCITVQSSPGRGSSFRVFPPLVDGAVSPLAAAGTTPFEEVSLAPSATVLLVDDDPDVRGMGVKMLRSLDMQVIEASSGEEAVALFRRHHGEIRCVLCDLTMSGMDGWQTLEILRRIKLDIPVILASGYDHERVMQGAGAELPQALLGKPYQLAALKNAVARALAATE